jgi:hypothetical protein
MNIENLTPTQLRKAADLQEKIAKLQNEFAELGGEIPIPFKGKRGPKKGGMSAAGKAKIAAAQKARWAKFHAKTKPAAKSSKPAKKKNKMSAAGRAAIAAGAKARWAKVKAAGKKSL